MDMVALVLLVLAVFLAWRNFRDKKGDVRGATRIAGFVLAIAWLDSVLGAHHVPAAEVRILLFSILYGMVPAFVVWTFYLALEPYVRRRWPQSMISWSRVLSGGFRDPMVGAHLLFSIGLGTILAMLELGYGIARETRGPPNIPPRFLESLLGGRHLLAALANETSGLILEAMAFTFLIMLFRVLLRREWLAGAAFAVLLTAPAFTPSNVVPSIFGALTDLLFAVILLRVGGLFPTIVCGLVGFSLVLPITTDLSAWYSGVTIVVLSLILALTAYAFHTALAGRPLFKGELFDRV
jgi:serine/threonine-protein kinase